jgi:hypothetical protein
MKTRSAIGAFVVVCLLFATVFAYAQESRQSPDFVTYEGVYYVSPRRARIESLLAAQFFAARMLTRIEQANQVQFTKNDVKELLRRDIEETRRSLADEGFSQP